MLTTNGPSATACSLRRSREACESSVRVRPWDLKPQTSRRSCSFVKTRVGHQLQQQLVFLACKRDRSIGDRDGARRDVRADGARDADLVRRRNHATEDGTDAREQLVVDIGLRKKVVVAALQSTYAID